MNKTAQELIAAMQMLENPEQRKVLIHGYLELGGRVGNAFSDGKKLK